MSSWRTVLIGGMILGAIAGCNQQQKQFGGAIQPNDSKEPAKVTAKTEQPVAERSSADPLPQVRADYKRILEIMRRWYMEHGLHEKGTWAAKEMHDLNKVRMGQKIDPSQSSLQSIDLVNLSEADMVEQLQQIRRTYKRLLEEQQDQSWAKRELNDLNHVRMYPYIVEVDLQNTDLTPRDSIVEADRLFAEAFKQFQNSKYLPFINNKRGLKEALDKFVLLIKTYPTSDKIDDAAFYAGEISKEYFNDDVQAVRFYEMALKWDPKTPHPVRFQCAVIYDFRLHDRARAMALYQQVLTQEKDLIESNTAFSAERLKELLNEKEIGEPPVRTTNVMPPTSENK